MSVEPRSDEIPPSVRIRVWDVPTRLFHWSFAAAFAGEWLTRDARDLQVHEFLGYTIGALVVFRLAWGFAGTRWARFASFPLSASSAMRYVGALVRGRAPHHIGHNPAGSWTIYGLLFLAALEVATGILTLGAEKGLGPLAGRFGYRVGDLAHEAHWWLAYGMGAVAVVHVAGAIYGSFAERENLVASMVTGYKRAGGREPDVEPRRGMAIAMLAIAALGALASFGGFSLMSQPSTGAPPSWPLATDKTWIAECGGCHLAYHPSLLPARSWSRMLARQQAHFGEDLGLSAETVRHLAAYASANAAEALESPVAWKMATTIDAGSAPQRISETPYWIERHARLDKATAMGVRRSDCGACHGDADAGVFSPRAIDTDLARVAAAKPAKGG